jgi:glycerophosphoryl diester phosphodiesterase
MTRGITMKKTLINTYKSLTYNIKTLLLFETIYRMIGLLIIFPIARMLFYLSIRLSGYSYITNRLFLEYLFKPTTIIILIFLMIFLSIYIVIEMIFLSLLYDYGYHEKDIQFKSFVILGIRRSISVLKRYHVLIIGPAFLFFILVEIFHIVGIASTISIPSYWVEQMVNYPLIIISFYVSILMIVILFIETIFTLNLYTVDRLTFKEAYSQSRLMLKKNRLKMFAEFVLLNIILNGTLYLIYTLIILSIGAIVFITRGQEYVLGFLLTILYSVYFIIGLIATLVLIPINYALISVWYYENRERLGLYKRNFESERALKKPFNYKLFRRGVWGTIIIIFALNISGVLTVLAQPSRQVGLFNRAEIIAHRGASWDAPENTLSAFDLAIEQGADAVEFDVRMTSDGIPIIMHDATVGRTTNDSQNRRVDQLTLEEIKSFDAGSWFSEEFVGETIPTLEETFELLQGRTILFVELKVFTPEIEAATIELIELYGLENQVVLMSFNRLQLRRIKALNENIETLLLITTFYGDFNALISYPEVDNFGFERSLVVNNPDFVDRLHARNKGIYVWTVNSETHLQQVVDLEVDGIITDRPLVAREIAYSATTRGVIAEILREFFSRNPSTIA